VATSYTPIATIPQVDKEVFEQWIEPPTELIVLSTPDMSTPSPNRSHPNKFRVFRVYSTGRPTTDDPLSGLENRTGVPHPHPFKNDSIFEYVKTLTLGSSSKSHKGMDELARLFASGKVIPGELEAFRSATELSRLDKFAAESKVAGGPFITGSVKIKMPRTQTPKDLLSVEAKAPEFEISGIQYRSLIDIIIAKVQDPSSSKSFVHVPFTEWWLPPESSTPIRVYGEAYSSDVAVKMYEEVKDIPPPEGDPRVENVVVFLKLGSDATLLANHGTATLWPIYVFFGNIPKDKSSKPSEFDVCHLAYLPKVIIPHALRYYFVSNSVRLSYQIHFSTPI
jgi:Plavaka transposase